MISDMLYSAQPIAMSKLECAWRVVTSWGQSCTHSELIPDTNPTWSGSMGTHYEVYYLAGSQGLRTRLYAVDTFAVR